MREFKEDIIISKFGLMAILLFSSILIHSITNIEFLNQKLNIHDYVLVDTLESTYKYPMQVIKLSYYREDTLWKEEIYAPECIDVRYDTVHYYASDSEIHAQFIIDSSFEYYSIHKSPLSMLSITKQQFLGHYFTHYYKNLSQNIDSSIPGVFYGGYSEKEIRVIDNMGNEIYKIDLKKNGFDYASGWWEDAIIAPVPPCGKVIYLSDDGLLLLDDTYQLTMREEIKIFNNKGDLIHNNIVHSSFLPFPLTSYKNEFIFIEDGDDSYNLVYYNGKDLLSKEIVRKPPQGINPSLDAELYLDSNEIIVYHGEERNGNSAYGQNIAIYNKETMLVRDKITLPEEMKKHRAMYIGKNILFTSLNLNGKKKLFAFNFRNSELSELGEYIGNIHNVFTKDSMIYFIVKAEDDKYELISIDIYTVSIVKRENINAPIYDIGIYSAWEFLMY